MAEYEVNDSLDMSTVFLLHEVESGMNPELNQSLYQRILADRIDAAIGGLDCD